MDIFDKMRQLSSLTIALLIGASTALGQAQETPRTPWGGQT